MNIKISNVVGSLIVGLLLSFNSPSFADQSYSKEQVRVVCTNHYVDLVNQIMVAMAMGLSAEQAKKELSGNGVQITTLKQIIDAIDKNDTKGMDALFNKLVDQCTDINYKKLNEKRI